MIWILDIGVSRLTVVDQDIVRPIHGGGDRQKNCGLPSFTQITGDIDHKTITTGGIA